MPIRYSGNFRFGVDEKFVEAGPLFPAQYRLLQQNRLPAQPVDATQALNLSAAGVRKTSSATGAVGDRSHYDHYAICRSHLAADEPLGAYIFALDPEGCSSSKQPNASSVELYLLTEIVAKLGSGWGVRQWAGGPFLPYHLISDSNEGFEPRRFITSNTRNWVATGG
jgi:hypothetical protein